jgi:hypothetical protein
MRGAQELLRFCVALGVFEGPAPLRLQDIAPADPRVPSIVPAPAAAVAPTPQAADDMDELRAALAAAAGLPEANEALALVSDAEFRVLT